ncbi:hypothetical protein [Burkholderia sp. Bp8992]|nr:hypothetical protein [Burkholderia sp. Bp8992]
MGERLFRTLKMQDAAGAPGGRGSHAGNVAAIVVFVDSKNLLIEF